MRAPWSDSSLEAPSLWTSTPSLHRRARASATILVDQLIVEEPEDRSHEGFLPARTSILSSPRNAEARTAPILFE